MKGKKLIVAGSIILAALGLTGGIIVLVKKTNEKTDDRKKTSKEEKTPRVPEISKNVIIKKIETKPVDIPEIIKTEDYTNARELLRDVLYYLIKKESFFSPEELLEKAIKICGQKIEDYSWYEELPKNTGELESSIEEFGYTTMYQIAMRDENNSPIE